MNRKKLKLYTLSTCVHCRAAKQFLKENGIDYEYIDVDILDGKEKQDAMSKLMELSGGLRFPTIIIGDKIIVGFRKDELTEALGL